ncbi:MAG: Gfo/Idh/MocA family oxidoreductase [Melioribacteraceae bacterium]|nr:Gfo/Idh/MocA family oxidoreductase [Melioribacteraceae bacterium]MCF8264458.1 Gfo/Idh/MocA family oxidoreductase [Melioribacteraceae bacterium]MCF8414500.1 Gfo/Idh/MocA family oxidoreductase [Melioribacteraceae bacterium]
MIDSNRRRLAKLKWGVAGCGKFTELNFLPAFSQLKKSRLISVYSSDLNRARNLATRFHGMHAHNNFDEFLKGDFDALYIGSRNADHSEQVIRAAEAGKNIFCEKPLALNYSDAKKMVEACEKNNVFLAINYVYRFHPLVTKAKELIQKDLLGKIVSISADFFVDVPPSDNFRYDSNEGGALRDLGTHTIDLLRYLGGNISEIQGYLTNLIYQTEVEDTAYAIVKFKEGHFGRFGVSFNAKKSFNRLEVVGHKGAVSIEGLIGKKNNSAKLIIDLDGEARKAFRKRSKRMIFILREIQKSFQRKIPPTVSGYDGLVNIELMERLLKK